MLRVILMSVKRILIYGAVGLAAGFVVGAVFGWLSIALLSTNAHDISLEAEMTAFFFAGPLLAIIGCVLGILLSLRKPHRSG